MYEKEFAERIAQLRIKAGVSARDMSLALGQNHGYINSIENGKALPSMAVFFYICEYLDISPSEFFDTDADDPKKLQSLIEDLKQLNDSQLSMITSVVREILKAK